MAIVEAGESAREAARLLNICASTAIRWIERRARLDLPDGAHRACRTPEARIMRSCTLCRF